MAPKIDSEVLQHDRASSKTGRAPQAAAALPGEVAAPTMPSGRAPWNHPLPPPRHPLTSLPMTSSTDSSVRHADSLLFPSIYILPEEVPRFYWELNALPISWHLAEEENIWYVYCVCLRPRVITQEAVAQLTPLPKAAKATSPELPPAQAASPFMSDGTLPTAIPLQLRWCDYPDAPDLSASKAARPSHSEIVAKAPRSELRGSMWPFDDSEDDARRVSRTPSPDSAYSPPPEFPQAGAYSSPTPPSTILYPVAHNKRGRMCNQSMPPPNKRPTHHSRPNPYKDIGLQGNATEGGSSSHKGSEIKSTGIPCNRNASGNRNASNAASASTNTRDNQERFIGVTARTHSHIFSFGCQCGDCINGMPPRTKAKDVHEEHIMHLHQQHRRMMKMHICFLTGGDLSRVTQELMISALNRDSVVDPPVVHSLPPPPSLPPPMAARPFSTGGVGSVPVAHRGFPPPSRDEISLMFQERTLQDIVRSGDLGDITLEESTSPTELAPFSVRSSNSPGGEPEQEPDDEAIPSITSPPGDIYLL